jgi:hypothetical protein
LFAYFSSWIPLGMGFVAGLAWLLWLIPRRSW